MALKLLDTVAPCFTYQQTGSGRVYRPQLLTQPRQYAESISRLAQFFYDPYKDLCVGFFLLDYAYWPSWRFARVAWNAATGAVNDYYTTRSANIIFSTWINHISVGGLDRFYATGNGYLTVKEIDWQSQSWTGWECYNWPGRNPPVFHQAIVNRTDSLVVGNTLGPVFFVFNYQSHELVRQIATPHSTYNGYMAYENEEIFWCVYATGQIAKINYQTGRYELLSQVAPGTADLSYRCAFDTRRKRLAVLRHKPDAVDGACRLQLDFYAPEPQPAVLTAPVPVSPLTAGGRTTFMSYLLGDAGEGIAARAVTGALAESAAGRLLTGRALTTHNGCVALDYLAPAGGEAIETLTVTTEV